MKRYSKILALALAAVMVLSLLPVAALAADPAVQNWAWDSESGRLAVDYEGFLSQHDLVYNRAPRNAETESMPVANGQIGASVWQDNGIRMQLHAVDNAPNSAFSTAQVKLSTVPALAGDAFSQRLNLYDGYIDIAQDNGFTAEIMGIPGTETLGLHVKDTRPGVRMITFDIEMWIASDSSIQNGGTTEFDAWKTLNYFEEDGVAGFTKGISEKEPFGYAFAATVDGADATVLQLDDQTARIYITAPESGEYTIWMTSTSRYHLEQDNKTGVYASTAADTFAAAKQELENAKALGYDAAMEQFQNWWHDWWESSFVHYETANEAEGDYIENYYYLMQYHLAGGSDAVFPQHFTRTIYTTQKDDNVQWNQGYWHFNQRATYNGMLSSNHISAFLRHLDYYDRVKDVMTEYTRQRFGFEDAMKTTETMRWDGYPKVWPLAENEDYASFGGLFDNDYVGWIYSTGPEVAENMYYTYKYTMDQELLEQYYDYMKRTVQFIVQWARWDEETQQYHLDNSNSLENWWKVNNSTPDNAAARSLVPMFLDAAEILGRTEEDAELIAKAKDVLEKLEPITIVKDEDRYAPYDIYDYTVGLTNSQNPELEAVYPHGIAGLDHDGLQTAINTYNARSNRLNAIWCVDGMQAARLGLGDEAAGTLGGMIGRNQQRITGYCYDGNGRLESMGLHVSTLNEMYLQSYDDLIRVFPAVPTDSDFQGAFTLLASGGFLVSSEYDQQQVQYIGLLSQYGGEATVKIPWQDAQTVLLNGTRTDVTDGRITFDTKAGETYLILPISAEGVQIQTTEFTGTANADVKTAFGKTLGIAGTGGGVEPAQPTNVEYTFEDSMEDGFFADSISGNDAVIHGDVTTEEHNGGKAAVFNGGYLQIEDSETFSPWDNFEMSFELKTTGGGAMTIFDKCAPLGVSTSTGLYIDLYNGNMRVLIGNTALQPSAAGLMDGQWHAVRLVYSTTLGTMELFFDDVSQGSVAISNPIPLIAGPGRIGISRLSNQQFYGSLDNLSIQPLDIPEPEDQAPQAVADTYNVDYHEQLLVRFPGILQNDVDEKPGDLTAELVSGPQHGSLKFFGDGGFRYEPEADYRGKDSFVYIAYDAAGQYSKPATVTLHVGMSPLANDDVFSAFYGAEFAGNVADNDTTATGAALGAEDRIVFVPTEGQEECPVTLQEDGSFTVAAVALPTEPGYYPDSRISFQYRIESNIDGEMVVSEPATAVVTVTREAADPDVFYDFTEAFDGTTIPDASGNENHGEIVGNGVTRTEDGTCAFDGQSYVKIAHSETFDLRDNFELSMKIKTDKNRNQVLFDKSNKPGDWVTGGLYIDTDGGNIRVFSEVITTLYVPAPFTTEKFTELRLTYSTEKGTMDLYLDGELKGSTPVDQALPYVPSYGVIGKKLSSDAYYFQGEIDDFQIKALSEVHTHTMTHTPAKDPTCTEAGNKEYWYCAGCDKYFSDAEGTTEITKESTVLPVADHTPVTVAGKKPTCTETGLTDGSQCSVCGKVLTEQKEIPALGHDFGTEWKSDKSGHWHECSRCDATSAVEEHIPGPEATETEPQLCTVCGYILEPETGHITHTPGTEWYHDETQHWHKCIGCEEKLEIADHTGGTATCTEQAVCEVCGAPYGELAEHTYEWAYDDSQHWKVCEDCGEIDGSTYAAHTWVEDEERSGEKTVWYTCECGAEKSESRVIATPTYILKAEQADGGKISPESKAVSRGGELTFTITPDAGYHIADVLVDGKSVGAVSEYTFKNVSSHHTITAQFTNDTAPVETVKGFTDVTVNDWFADAVEYAVENGLMNGTSDTTFSPKGDTTRGMIVTILYRLAGSPDVESDGATWWSDARMWAMEKGISDGTNMDGAITREQLATMLYRYAGSEEVKGDLSAFADADKVSDWATDALIWATANEIVTGKTGNLLDPQAGATRAETATILMRYCECVQSE